ncbi:putative u3 small nucleolar rna-associated protein 6 protein [Phaeoacremonium minimum UCRPA7]|uniref:Putative u3 small nucleolar rna-associated protein 6 protein n=1 Tax=Phaeoacremonium minimum (strain UCR-PA7) TaxID=1286976 RepID=R8BGM2_PHAM7|nr:putative u3 small nucleolar rna-associated protein 6 protein [Phaeoacremonium minimum UCRPA7]EON98463.1 putative u3 small nucleolar rna-associated protein 6 protein [Phaeoacremonium minimum UCRPA7]
MANVAEKARFYLERSVPQLREFEEKEIFSKDEIRTLVQKRSEFEHIVLGPGSKPADFQAYIAWELSLEALRAKRCRRLKIKHATSHAGQAKVFNIYERAVFRHPGSVTLWRQYLDYAADVKATRRWRKIVTRALRLHPMDAGLWAMAARRAARNGDMDNARSLFMRGCRFCNTEPVLWIEYARSEMEWLGRMEGKKGTKALAAARSAETEEEDDIIRLNDDSEDEDDDDGDDVLIPDLAAADGKKAKKVFNEEAVKKLEKSPALDGAIPRAIFEVSKKQPFFGPEAAEAFFNLFSLFTDVGAQAKLIQFVLDSMAEMYPNHAATCSCLVRHPLVGVDVSTAAFPKALRESLARIKVQTEATEDRELFTAKTVGWIDPILAKEDLDSALRTVLEHTKRKLESP